MMAPLPACLLYTQDAALARRMAGYLHERAALKHIARPEPLADEARGLAPCPILVDIQADGALALVRQLRDEAPDALTIALGYPRSGPALEAEALGAYAVEPPDLDRRRAQALFRRACEHLSLLAENRELRARAAAPAVPAPAREPAAPLGHLHPLSHLARAFSSYPRIENLLATVLDGLANTHGISRLGVFSLDRRGQRFGFRAGIRCLPGMADIAVPAADPLPRWLQAHAHMIARGTLVHVERVDERILLKRWLDVLGAELIVPLYGRQQLIGWLLAGHRASGAPFDQADIDGFLPVAADLSLILENALLHEEADSQRTLIETVLRKMPAGVVVAGPDGAVQWLNEAAAPILGTTADALAGQPVQRLGSRLADLLLQALRGAPPADTVKYIDPASRLPLGVTVRQLVHDGTNLGAAAVIQDLSRERLLREKQERIERAAFWTELAAAISHEVRNPLVAISTFAQLLPERYGDPEFRNQFAQIAVGEIARLNKLIDQINEFANPPELGFAEQDAAALLKTAARRAAEALPARPTPIHVSCNGNLPPVWGDEAALVQCFMSLLANALEATARTAEPRIDVIAAPAVLRDGESAVAIQVRDNGAGIASDIVDKVFSPFCSTKARGIGLGLPIVKRTVTDHDGQVGIETGRQGTTVTVTLPAAGARKGAADETAHPRG